MYKEKPKNENMPRRTFRNGLLIGVLIGVALMFIVGALLWAKTPLPTAEMLVVPFNKPDSTWTTQAHSGFVMLTIKGTGQAAGSDFSDAFYQYTQGGQTLASPLTHQFDLEIDGNRAIITLEMESSPPPYNPEHIYTVVYDVGKEPRQIAFRISDMITDDNAGQFMIGIRRWFAGG